MDQQKANDIVAVLDRNDWESARLELVKATAPLADAVAEKMEQLEVWRLEVPKVGVLRRYSQRWQGWPITTLAFVEMEACHGLDPEQKEYDVERGALNYSKDQWYDYDFEVEAASIADRITFAKGYRQILAKLTEIETAKANEAKEAANLLKQT